ncbi:hypothetical protein GCM10007425_24510 [Lysinibacillus alkalisoli]|uniref:NYN domain-containing protein n=1 Tax=Lysinibacillus alkalisoli TaxID=1911548 RepID=A0A917G8U9_9BACI|nr:NYN domain-containing protein [Lysinibacillus alkalisoli]GGG29037.1 hypothetical protein GCM10007425_24510 [Lysinibacillus alkalisoli]
MKHILLVDGYNMIGAWQALRQLRDTDFESARDQLVELMAEYQAAEGYRVIIVFDAYLVQGNASRYRKSGVEVIYTAKNETADEHIERLTNELKGRHVQIHVATSDMTEQNVIFGNGALRKSARELEIEVGIAKSTIDQQVKDTNETSRFSRISASPEVMEKLERMRRGLS